MKKVKIGCSIVIICFLFSLVFMGKGEVNSALRVATPNLSHIFGCDTLGRDLLSRVSYGVIVSLTISFSSSLIGVMIGILLSLMNTRRGGLSVLAQTIISSFKSIPTVLIGLFLASLTGGGWWSVIIALSISSSVNAARVLSVKINEIESNDYITAERALGLKQTHIIRKHIIPSLFPYIKEEWAIGAMSGILTESALSYLGLGLDPSIPTLGGILAEGRALVLTRPHIVLFPSLFLLIIGLGVLLISKGLSELNSSSHRAS